MVRRASVKDFLREIKKTISRFISIVLLLILSVSFFAGLRVTKPDMQITADKYMDLHNLYDVRVLSTLGMTYDDIDAIKNIDGIAQAVSTYQFDAVAAAPKQDIVITIQTLSADNNLTQAMNSPELLAGQMPTRDTECVVEERFLKTMEVKLGDVFDIKEVQKSFEEALVNRVFKIVGVVRTPAYISKMQRGSSALGSGSVSAFIMIKSSAVSLDYFTAVDITVVGAKKEVAYTEAYKNLIQAATDRLKELEKTQAPIRYQEVVLKANTELDRSRTELTDKKAELEDSVSQLSDAKIQLADGRVQLTEEKAKAEAELKKAWNKLQNASRDIQNGLKALDEAQKNLDNQTATGENQLAAARQKLTDSQAALHTAQTAYAEARARLDQQLSDWNALPESVKQTMPEKAAELEAATQQLDAQKQELDTQQTTLNASVTDLHNQEATLHQQLLDAQQKIDAQAVLLQSSQEQLATGYQQYDTQKAEADKKIADAEQELNDAALTILDSEAKITDGQAKMAQAEAEIKDAAQKIADIKEAKWFVQDRGSDIGYSNYGQDADRMGALGNVFPMIFFAVAALVCLTTMTRMVDEKRGEIGTYKALGCSRWTTAGKFINYSLFATVIGVSAGLLVGSMVFPQFIFKAYSIMYNLPPLETPLHLDIGIVSSTVALVCTVGATIAACFNALRETPASLLRPKAPEPGKRVLVEFIKPLWKRMSFFAKVSARNIFRYKKRLIMTLLGIAGCTALVVTGFGLKDSITGIADMQFGKILKYNLQVFLSVDAADNKIEEILKARSDVSDFIMTQSIAVDADTNAGIITAHIIVPKQPDKLKDFVQLAHRADGTAVMLSDTGAVITEKMAELLKLKIGDTFTIDSSGKYTAFVADIIENYVYHTIYMTPQYYESISGKETKANQVLIKLKEDSEETANDISAALLKLSDVSYISYFGSIAKSFKDSMNSVNYVVIIILISAGLLALVVLYNLTNINITERNRELATIKVLGFFDREVSWYIFRENTILTIAGIIIGLVGGRFLHGWLVRTIELDFVMFGRQAKPMSYVFAAALTLLFAVVVNIVGHRHMKRINMVESLKTND